MSRPWFDEVRARAIAVRGTDKDMFTTVFYPGVSHRPSWENRDAAEWLDDEYSLWDMDGEGDCGAADGEGVGLGEGEWRDCGEERDAGGSRGWGRGAGCGVAEYQARGSDGAAGCGLGGDEGPVDV